MSFLEKIKTLINSFGAIFIPAERLKPMYSHSPIPRKATREDRTRARRNWRSDRTKRMRSGCPVLTGERLRKTLLCCPRKNYATK